MEYKELAPGLREYQLSADQIAKLDYYMNAIHAATHLWQESGTMGNKLNYRTSSSFLITPRKMTEQWLAEIDQYLFMLFNAAILQYQQDYDLLIANDEGYEVLKYGIGKGYKKHVDQGGHQFGRILSGLLYVNENYVGGQLEFTKLGIKIQPRRGTILLFPSNFIYEHIAHPVQQGEKVAIVTFFHPEDEVYTKNKEKEKANKRFDPHGASNL